MRPRNQSVGSFGIANLDFKLERSSQSLRAGFKNPGSDEIFDEPVGEGVFDFFRIDFVDIEKKVANQIAARMKQVSRGIQKQVSQMGFSGDEGGLPIVKVRAIEKFRTVTRNVEKIPSGQENPEKRKKASVWGHDFQS